jgi:hypothetical protein
MIIMTRLTILFVLVVSQACATSESCSAGSEICYDLIDVPNPAAFCASGGLTQTSGMCPAARRVGRCTLSGVDDRGASITYRISYYEPRTTDEVRSGCIGTFEAN